MRRRDFITLVAANAFGWPASGVAQAGDRPRRLGILTPFPRTDPVAQARLDALRRGLKELGWVEGTNLQILEESTNNDLERVPDVVRKLVGLSLDAIVVLSAALVHALLNESRTLPIVFVAAIDPVATGVVQSLAHPGGNATGFTAYDYDIVGKWLQILKEIAPGITECSALLNPDTALADSGFLQPFTAAGHALAVKTKLAPVRGDKDIQAAIGDIGKQPHGGLIVLPDTFLTIRRDQIVALANRYRIPTIYPLSFFPRAGGLVSYGVDTIDLFRQAASYVDRIFRGQKPGDMPIQNPTKFELVVNLKTAKALGLAIPQSILLQASEVIE